MARSNRAFATPVQGEMSSQCSHFDIEECHVEGQLAYRCAGELDMASAPLLRTATAAADGDVLLDLAEVTFVDSSGIAVLIGIHKRLIARGHELRLTGVREVVRKVLDLTGASGLIPIDD